MTFFFSYFQTMVKHPIAILLVVGMLILLAASSCRKEKILHINATAIPVVDSIADTIPVVIDTLPVARALWPMLKTIYSTDYQGNVSTEHFYYDSVWRLLRYNSYNGNNNTSYTYNYKYDSLNRGVYVNTDYLSFTNGLVTSRYSYNQTYTYNANTNQVTNTQLHGYIDYYYGAIFNMDSSHVNGEYNSNDRINYDDSYFYNTHINTIGNYNKGLYMWGKSSVYLPDYAINKMYLSSSGPPVDFFNFTLYSYQYNDSGWVSHQQMKRSAIAQTYTDSVNYTLDTTYYIYNYDYTYY
jgi:hypothetical protein